MTTCVKIPVVALVAVAVLFTGCARTAATRPAALAQNQTFRADSLEGYWQSRSDGLETHITGLVGGGIGSGTFKDIYGVAYPAGKFRNIKYLGGNRWECESWRHPRDLVYDKHRSRMFWEHAIIEMLDINTFRVDNTIYRRV
jgi:hypothetical protein